MSGKAVEMVLSWMTKRIDGPLINKGFQRRSIFRRKDHKYKFEYTNVGYPARNV